MPTATTVGGWVALLALGTGYYFINSQRKNKNKRPLSKQAERGKENQSQQLKTKKGKKESGNSSGEHEVKAQKEKKKTKAPFTTFPANDDQTLTNNGGKSRDRDEDGLNDREFAQQMQNAKTGTVSAAKPSSSTKPRSIKQTQAKEKGLGDTAYTGSSDNATAPSSTTGGDADDDESPSNSPDLSATTSASPFTNGISDMLEQPAPGPSVLKITPPTNPSHGKKEKVAPTPETAETKKQRQNKKKAEAKKLQREEDEKERKIMQEKQRRTAREAEGRAARDGSAFMAKAPSASAWADNSTATTASGNGQKTAPASNVELLDTHEPSSSSSAIAKPAATTGNKQDELYSESEIFGSESVDISKMSEEDQVEQAKEESIRWEVVKSKSKDRKKKSGGKNKEAKESQSSTDDVADFAPPPKIAPTPAGQAWEEEVVSVDTEGSVLEETIVVKDSEWEVS